MNKKIGLLFVLVLCFGQSTFAANKADSILAITNGAHSKFVWQRFAWAKDDYTPNGTMLGYIDNKTSGNYTTLMVYNTVDNQTRVLDATVGNHHIARISRSGKWVTWNDVGAKTSYIRDFNGASAKKTFVSSTTSAAWFAAAHWIDPVSKAEYVYAIDNYQATSGKNKISKIKINADGSPDLAGKTTISVNGSSNLDEMISVSQNGEKIGCGYPWPNTGVVDVKTGSFTVKHDGQFGCQANLSPDNSYRFFHCQDQHAGIYMWGANLVEPHPYVPLGTNWPGLPANFQTSTPSADALIDFSGPRWTNHVQYFTNTTPMIQGYFDGDCAGCGSINGLVGLSAATVKTLKPYLIPQMSIGKWNANFSAIENYVIVSADIRYAENGWDGWVSSGVTDGATSTENFTSKAINKYSNFKISTSGSTMNLDPGTNETVTIRVTNAMGKVVSFVSTSKPVVFNTSEIGKGVFIVSVKSSSGVLSEKVFVQ